MPASGERSPQRHRRTRRNRHQYDPDLCEPGQVEQAGDHQREHGYGDQHREETANHRLRLLPDPLQLTEHDAEPDTEHHREHGDRDERGEHPFRNLAAHRRTLASPRSGIGLYNPYTKPLPNGNRVVTHRRRIQLPNWGIPTLYALTAVLAAFVLPR